jgi:hypothetical protein
MQLESIISKYRYLLPIHHSGHHSGDVRILYSLNGFINLSPCKPGQAFSVIPQHLPTLCSLFGLPLIARLPMTYQAN